MTVLLEGSWSQINRDTSLYFTSHFILSDGRFCRYNALFTQDLLVHGLAHFLPSSNCDLWVVKYRSVLLLIKYTSFHAGHFPVSLREHQELLKQTPWVSTEVIRADMRNISRLSHFSTHWILAANLINTLWLFQMATWQVTTKTKGLGMLWHVPGFYLPHFQHTCLCVFLSSSTALVTVDLLQTWYLCFPGLGSTETQRTWLNRKANTSFCFPYIFQFITSALLCVPSPFCISFHLANTTWSCRLLMQPLQTHPPPTGTVLV